MDYKLPKNYRPATRNYRHQCPVCDDYFYGRKNMIYHPWCKVWKANEKAAIVHEMTKNEDKQRKDNHKMLRLLSMIGFMDKPIPLYLLEKLGLDLAYAVKLPSEEWDECYQIYNYLLLICGDDINRTVLIMET